MIYAHFQNKVVEALFVDDGQGIFHVEGELDEPREMLPLGHVCILLRFGYTGGSHVRRAYRLDLYDVLVLVLIEDLFRGDDECLVSTVYGVITLIQPREG